MNLPLYSWKSIYTTNYDELVEVVYDRRSIPLQVFSSNFDFGVHNQVNVQRLYKLHGTIKKDVCDGNKERLILTASDYDNTQDYREYLFKRLETDLSEANLLIIGQSLADPDIRTLVESAQKLKSQIGSNKQITLFMYEKDEDRADLMEARGLQVVFGGLDEFFAAIADKTNKPNISMGVSDPIEGIPALSPVTISVSHFLSAKSANISAMFNGNSATFSDIEAGLTFERTSTAHIVGDLLSENIACVVILGASGVGKTTAARQVLLKMRDHGYLGWEHKFDQPLQHRQWIELSQILESSERKGILLVDDAHAHLFDINYLIEEIVSRNLPLKLLITSSKNHWNPRVKSPQIFKRGKEYQFSTLDYEEINRLLILVQHTTIEPLLENTFSGFTRPEKRRRLTERCHSDMFVCLKNIFASEKFDDIILREYASLDPKYQEVYKYVAALEAAGIRVHRQLIMRLLGVPPVSIPGLLSNMTDVVSEYDIDVKEGIYGWKGRHPVITGIIADYKFSEKQDWIKLFERVIDNISPTYDIEIRSIRELCNIAGGLSRLKNKTNENRLLRRIISVAPSERVPRHRLIRNLIEMGEFDNAATEIRLFEKDFGYDAPVSRYRINLMVARATNSAGLLQEDKLVILEDANVLAKDIVRRFPLNKYVLASYADVGIEYYRLTGKYDIYDDSIKRFQEAETQSGDPDISNLIRRYEKKIEGQTINYSEFDDTE